MTAANPLKAYNTTIQRGDGGSPEAFTAIAMCKGSDFGFEAEDTDVSHMTSPQAHRERVPTFWNSKDLKLDVIWNKNEATHGFAAGGIGADLKDLATGNYRFVFPDGTYYSFTLYCADLNIKADFGGVYQASVVLRHATAPTLS